MAIFLVDQSAVDFWRANPQLILTCGHPGYLPVVSTQVTASQIEFLLERNVCLEGGCHILVDKRETSTRQVVRHFYPQNLKSMHFVKVSADIYVASPEYCFVQMAARMPLNKLLLYGMELCGVYHEIQLTTVAKISLSIECMKDVKGLITARRVLKYLENGAASIMESRMYLLMCLPRHMGGYGLPKAALNQEIALSPQAQVLCDKETLRGDLCWPGLFVEYESYEHHSGRQELEKDAHRRTSLQIQNIEIITVTHGQLVSRAECDAVAQLIAKKLGYRMNDRSQSKTEEARMKLRRDILGC